MRQDHRVTPLRADVIQPGSSEDQTGEHGFDEETGEQIGPHLPAITNVVAEQSSEDEAQERVQAAMDQQGGAQPGWGCEFLLLDPLSPPRHCPRHETGTDEQQKGCLSQAGKPCRTFLRVKVFSHVVSQCAGPGDDSAAPPAQVNQGFGFGASNGALVQECRLQGGGGSGIRT